MKRSSYVLINFTYVSIKQLSSFLQMQVQSYTTTNWLRDIHVYIYVK